nr:MAG TPA: hypothetical protein [Caudoviricetes sp.]
MYVDLSLHVSSVLVWTSFAKRLNDTIVRRCRCA